MTDEALKYAQLMQENNEDAKRADERTMKDKRQRTCHEGLTNW